jgi:septal ring factor EnvC (AmiA/AmiB activator)
VASPESRVRSERLALVIALAMSPGAWAGGARDAPAPPSADPDGEPHPAPQDPSPYRAHDHGDALDAGGSATAGAAALAAHDALAQQLADEAAAADRAAAAVADKLTTARATRLERLRAAYRLLRAVPGEDAMGVTRRRAAARLLIARDAGERALLVEQAAQLRAAHDRIAGEATRLPSITLPSELARPAPGKIARHFGVLAHERSKATLSRRGLDLEVDDHSAVTAPAAGTVRYAGPIRGLDQGVIIDHGAYLTVLAKLGEVALPVGAPIAAGDRVGRAARHRVYFEVRVKLGPGGLPIDPEPLLGKPR